MLPEQQALLRASLPKTCICLLPVSYRWLEEQCRKTKDHRACASSVLKLGVQDGEVLSWKCWASADLDRQQTVSLIATAGTSDPGGCFERSVRTIHSSGRCSYRKEVLQQDSMHHLYRRAGFSNSLPGGQPDGCGRRPFEETWLSWKWWVCEWQYMLALTEVNAFLLWRKYNNPSCTMGKFRRRLIHQMLTNKWWLSSNGAHLRSAGESLATPAEGLEHYLLKIPGSDVKPGVKSAGTHRCFACQRLTSYHCACNPITTVGGPAAATGIAVCATHDKHCFARHVCDTGLKDKKKRKADEV